MKKQVAEYALTSVYLTQYKHTLFSALLLFACLCFITVGPGCSSSLDSTSGSTVANEDAVTRLSQYIMPSEISAVPVSNNEGIAEATDDGTDYSKAVTRKYVEEHTLQHFTMLENVLKAIVQTNYQEQLGQGPYKAMVAFEEDGEEGKSQKALQAWVCRADIVDTAGNLVSVGSVRDGVTYHVRVWAWIEEQDEDGIELIKAEFLITSPPTQLADGTYSDYGEWTLNVKFDEEGDDYFVASCEKDGSGNSVIKLHERIPEQGFDTGEFVTEVKGYMHRSSSEGYGKIYYPEWEEFYCPDCDQNVDIFPHATVRYAYNDAYLAVQGEDDNSPVYKSRAVDDTVLMTHRYGVFHSDTGRDVMKSKSFGFPIFWTENGLTKRGYYGAWQGRHEIWAQEQGGAPQEGTIVTREDHDPDSAPETYTVGETFGGVLVKRSYVDADLNDIKDIPVEIWVNQNYNLTWDDAEQEWTYCDNMVWPAPPAAPYCDGNGGVFGDDIGFNALMVGENDYKKHVYIGGWDQSGQENLMFIYTAAFSAGGTDYDAGFYEAEEVQGDFGMKTRVATPVTPLNTANVTSLWIDIGGSIYVEYKGENEGWVEKELVNFDERTWTPEFNPAGDKAYILPSNNELYVNMQGATYIVKKVNGETNAGIELQTAVNPTNVDNILGGNTIFVDQWNPENNSTFEFVTSPSSTDYLMLVFKTIGDNHANDGAAVVGAIATNVWGIRQEGSSTDFNWEYNAEGGRGSVTYLKNINGSYKLLDDPMRFESITATNRAGETKTLVLQYDGWMMGLPDMHYELQKNDWVMTRTLADKIINLPAMTEVVDAETGIFYVLKPLEVSQFLPLVANPTGTLPNIALAASVDLDSVPDFVDPGIGDMPTDTEVLYSEGLPIDE